MVPEVSKKLLPQLALGFSDKRVELHITDGIKWVTEVEEGTYDAIIVDSSDPVGPAEVLFEKVPQRQLLLRDSLRKPLLPLCCLTEAVCLKCCLTKQI
jgi:predicted membrane-bound spermidine synthase